MSVFVEGAGNTGEPGEPGEQKKYPKRYRDPVLWVWLKTVFTAMEYQFENNTLSPDMFSFDSIL